LTGNNDLKNIQIRGDRKDRHNRKVDQELADFFKLYASKIEIITYYQLDHKRKYGEYLVRFRLDQPMKPKEFLKVLIESIGDKV